MQHLWSSICLLLSPSWWWPTWDVFPFSSCSKEMGRLMCRSPVVEEHICYESNEAVRVEIGEQLPLKAPEDHWELLPHSLGEHIWRFARLQVQVKKMLNSPRPHSSRDLVETGGENCFFQKEWMCWLEGGWRKKAQKLLQVPLGSRGRCSPAPSTACQSRACGWMLLLCS